MMRTYTKFNLKRGIFGMAAALMLCGLIFGAAEESAAFTVSVNSTSDSLDAKCGNIKPTNFFKNNNDISLREAVCAANNESSDDIINLPAGTYTLTFAGVEDGNLSGDLDIKNNGTLTISGASAATTTISAGSIDRVLHNLSGATLILNNVTLTGGVANGGGIYNAGAATFNDVNIQSNTAPKGGGVYNYNSSDANTFTCNRCTLQLNRATDGSQGGGALYNRKGTATFNNSTLKGNSADQYAGAVWRDGGYVYLYNSTVTGNTANNSIGGLRSGSSGGITIKNSIIAKNTGGSYPDIRYSIASDGNNIIGNRGSQSFSAASGDQIGDSTTPIDPRFDVWAYHDGQTQMWSLKSDSPAIDKGSDCLSTDQRGESRPMGDGCDIGSYEYPGEAGTGTLNIVVVEPADAEFLETAGVGAAKVTVTRSDPTGSLDITLTSGDSDRVRVATSSTDFGTAAKTITLYDGASTATFWLEARSDSDSDANDVLLTASGANSSTGTDYDDDTETVRVLEPVTTVPTLSVEITPESIGEDGGTAIVTVTRSDVLSTPLDVTVSIPEDVKLKICDPKFTNKCDPLTTATVTILADKASAEFTVEGQNNDIADGDLSFTVTATEANHTQGGKAVEVTDDDGTTPDPSAPTLYITVSPSENLLEGSTATVTVKFSDGSAASGKSVTLTSSDTNNITLAGSSTKTVTADTDGVATFTITIVDDTTVMEPDILVTLTATATDYTNAVKEVKVSDNDYIGTYKGTGAGFPTFFFAASYDWLHSFSDRNTRHAVVTTTDPDTDNFNKILMVDANLFPIYTALQGDTEMPNIVMRNWTSGVKGYSPSANDYMNRSVATVANYINATTYTPMGYTRPDPVKAVGMRSHLEWAYVLDPANANFRRYKFVKIDDTLPSELYFNFDDPGNVTDKTDDSSFSATGMDCNTCNPDSWYVGTQAQVAGGNGAKDCETASCYSADDKFLLYAKSQSDGMTFDGNNPPAQFKLPIPIETVDAGGTVNISEDFYGWKHDNSATLTFVLNEGFSGTNCEKSDSFSTGDSNYLVTSKNTCGSAPYDANKTCKNRIDVDFASVPVTCAKDCNSQFCYMTLSIYPLSKQHGGWVLQLKGATPPVEIDNAFRIPIAGFDNITGAEWDMLDATEKQKRIDNRWGNLDGYLDTVPPKSYAGYDEYTSTLHRTLGYGFETNTSFSTANYVRFKDPRDLDTYRDYFDIKNGAPVYIFVADTGNSRIQVFMNATGVAGDVGASAPIRPVPVKGPNVGDHKTNELAMRPSAGGYGDGRKSDWRQTLDDSGTTFKNISVGKGEFFYPHGIAVDQDPDTKDVYLFVADTFNHRIQVFRDISGVSGQSITAKKFDFEFVGGFGTYPVNTTQPGAFHFRYPKGVDLVRYANNSSYLYVVDSKNYRLMKYQLDDPGADLASTEISATAGYGYDGAKFVSSLTTNRGTPITANNTQPGFLNPQDVSAGYSGFYQYTSSAGKGTQFLNNYMVYVSDYNRNDNSIDPDELNMRIQQIIQVPGFGNLSGSWIPWGTKAIEISAGPVRQSVYGLYSGYYHSQGDTTNASKSSGATENVPGVDGYFTDRPVGLSSLQWNTIKPIDIRVIDVKDTYTDTDGAYTNGDTLPRSTELRIGVSSRTLFMPPEDKAKAFLNSSSHWTDITGRWDSLYAGNVHLFCYDKYGVFKDHVLLTPPTDADDVTSYRVKLSEHTCPSGGIVKMVAEDRDFKYSARSGTVFFKIQ